MNFLGFRFKSHKKATILTILLDLKQNNFIKQLLPATSLELTNFNFLGFLLKSHEKDNNIDDFIIFERT